MKIIADVGDPTYYSQRARELIMESETCEDEERRKGLLRSSMSLLALAVAEIEAQRS